ncbi:MAG: SurA N-terminal domain-containing protein [Nitrosomonadales bacterium]|nr:SurA N-terminal domain-containing protein [Nitrosomonadales bacterium]
MFDFVHNNKRLVQIFMALIILPFAFWGIDSYTRSGNAANVAATVNGAKITQQEFENAMRQQQAKLRQELGARFDAAMLDNPEMKRAVLDNLVAQRLLVERASAAGLAVTDDQVARLIGSIEAFQNEGKFDKKRYAEVLSNQNMSPLMFEARLRDDLLGQQMQDTYVQNGFVSGKVVDSIIRLNEQQRVISLSPVSIQQFEAQAKVDDVAVKEYYDRNPKEFQIQEQARVEYVKLSADVLLSKISIDKDEMRRYYNEHLSEFGTSEERHAAHILISANAAATQSEQDAAKGKAEQLLQEVKRNPAKFAELAKRNSQDPGSAANGGDLGFFGRGMMVKPFEDAVYSLKVGEISEVVRSDFGYHIIKLVGIKSSKALPFDEARMGIENKLRQQKAADMFAELAEKFSNVVYEQSDTLKPAADLAGVEIEQGGWVTKGGATSALWTPMMVQAIFSDEVAKGKRNTSAIEVAPNTLVAARVLEYKPAAARAFGEVQGMIRQKLLGQQAIELAVKYGSSVLGQLQAGDKPKLRWGTAQSITRGQHGSLDASLVRQIFQADAAKLPQYVGAETAQNGYVIVRLDAVKEGEAISDAKRARYSQQLRQLTGEEMSRAYLADAKLQATIVMSSPEVVRVQP